ncbi:MAG: phosphate acyltransferase, partial [Candidatus Eisenbacteria bacterium]
MFDPIRSASQLIDAAVCLANAGGRQRIAVAAAEDPDVLEALSKACDRGMVEPFLFGNREKIFSVCRELSLDTRRFRIFHNADADGAALQAVAFADEGKADIIMKGFVSTSVILKAVLSKDFSLRRSDTLSHVAVLEVPGYHKLLSFTDGGVVVRPDLTQKASIVRNYLTVARALGIVNPRIALLG